MRQERKRGTWFWGEKGQPAYPANGLDGVLKHVSSVMLREENSDVGTEHRSGMGEAVTGTFTCPLV